MNSSSRIRFFRCLHIVASLHTHITATMIMLQTKSAPKLCVMRIYNTSLIHITWHFLMSLFALKKDSSWVLFRCNNYYNIYCHLYYSYYVHKKDSFWVLYILNCNNVFITAICFICNPHGQLQYNLLEIGLWQKLDAFYVVLLRLLYLSFYQQNVDIRHNYHFFCNYL